MIPCFFLCCFVWFPDVPETQRTPRVKITRAHLTAYQHFLHHYRSPRGDKPLVINTQIARLGCIRRFFAWLCRQNLIPANPAADLHAGTMTHAEVLAAMNAMAPKMVSLLRGVVEAIGKEG